LLRSFLYLAFHFPSSVDILGIGVYKTILVLDNGGVSAVLLSTLVVVLKIMPHKAIPYGVIMEALLEHITEIKLWSRSDYETNPGSPSGSIPDYVDEE